jgi:hypothetical protein
MAPDGFLLAPVDSSQIEFRVGAYLAGQTDVIDQLKRGEDPYVDIASEFYQEKIYSVLKIACINQAPELNWVCNYEMSLVQRWIYPMVYWAT